MNKISIKLLSISFSIYFCACGGAFGQSSESRQMWKNESFGDLDPEKEIVKMRDENTKHFRNGDGTVTAQIASGNIHYWENGSWHTIFHTIVPTANGFENTANSHKTYYPATSTGSITTILPNKSVIRDMMGMRMYFEKNGQEFQSQGIKSTKGSADFNLLTYPNVYGQGIDLRLTHNTSKRKMDYIIQSREALGSIPAGAQSLVFEEMVELPSGWSARLVNNTVLLLDGSGTVQARYEKPVFTETPKAHEHDHKEGEHAEDRAFEVTGKYEIKVVSGKLYIKTLVPLNWLMDAERNFPVTIDPTIDCYPNNVAWWTGCTETTSGTSSATAYSATYTSTSVSSSWSDNIYLGRNVGTNSFQSWAKFNISSLPNACINSAEVRYNVRTVYSADVSCIVNGNIRHMANDPVSSTEAVRLADIRDGDIYATRNFTVYTTGSGLVSHPLPNFLAHLSTAQPTGAFSLGFNTYEGGPHTTCYTGIYGFSSTYKPYLRVVYTPYYQVEFSNMTPTTFCAGETKNVSVTVKNVGCESWTSGWASPNSVNFSWWANWQSGGACPGQDCNGRILPFAALAPGASQTVTFSVTAPSTPGTYNIQTDLVRDGVCWFRGNGSPSCGPGNLDYIIPITVTSNPTPLSAGSNQTVSCGNAVSIGSTVTNSASEAVSTAIPDNNTTGITHTLNIPASYTCGVANNITSVVVNITHTFNGDLDIYLRAPDGTQIALAEDKGGSGDNYVCTFATGGTALPTSNTTINGTYAPQTAFSSLGTGSAAGNWSLIVKDDASGDVGTLTSWSITFPNCTYSWSPATGLSATNISNPTAAPPSTQTYTLTTTANGCSSTSSVTLTVNPMTITGTTSACVGATSDLNVAGEWASAPPFGTLVTGTSTNEYYRSFTFNGTFYTPVALSNVRLLVVGGGGGGGSNGGGGGGAGGVYAATGLSVAAGNTTVVVGAGGAVHNNSASPNTAATNGGQSAFGAYTAGGGGGGASRDQGLGGQAGTSGMVQGSGGGGGGSETAALRVAGTGLFSAGAGFAGSCNSAGGGGGGAGGAGAAAASNAGGAGGAGVQNNITGTNTWYAGGGGGGTTNWYVSSSSNCNGVSSWTNGTGGSTVGGNGEGTAPAANTGSGGGAEVAGSAGVVIVRYRVPKWESSNTGVATVNALTGVVTAVSAGTTTITYTSEFGCSSSTTFTVNALPSATVTTSSATICHGNAVNIGGAVTATGAWTVTLSTGATATGTGSGTWSASVAPSATTTYTISSVTNACTGSGTGSVTITLPTQLSSLANHAESATCAVNGNQWIHFYHASGRYIASIQPNNQNLGNVTMTSYVTGPQVMNACSAPSNPLYSTAYMGRSWVMNSTAYPSGSNFPANVTVRMPFNNTELTALNSHANTATTGNPNDGGTVGPVTLANMMMTKITSATTENGIANASDCSGGTIRAIISSPGSGASPQSISGASYKEFSIQQFSEMFLHKIHNNSALPVTLTSFSASCNQGTELTWTTASEFNSDVFIVEKSRDHQSWTFVEEIQAAGNSNTVLNYTATDQDPFAGVSYYRLVQKDFDGQQKVYGPISVACSDDDENTIHVFPNPSKGNFTVELSSGQPIENAEIQLVDMAGKIVENRVIMITEGVSQVLFNNETLQMGMYIVNVRTENNLFKPVKITITD